MQPTTYEFDALQALPMRKRPVLTSKPDVSCIYQPIQASTTE